MNGASDSAEALLGNDTFQSVSGGWSMPARSPFSGRRTR
jgi:hypothetical protein